jgi:hypothetical protein
MKCAVRVLLGLSFFTQLPAAHAQILNTLPEGFQFRDIRFKYDEQVCGKINFVLNPVNGDCSVEFENFFTSGSAQNSCDLTIEVDLPPGLAMTPSRLTIEGDYQFDNGGVVNLNSDYTIEGAADKIVLERHWSNTDAGLVANSFLEEEPWTAPLALSSCGGTAVFRGTFALSASSAPDQKQSLIDIGKTNQGASSDKKAPVAYWGWNYQLCNDSGTASK